MVYVGVGVWIPLVSLGRVAELEAIETRLQFRCQNGDVGGYLMLRRVMMVGFGMAPVNGIHKWMHVRS
jgi:hypothetical protein